MAVGNPISLTDNVASRIVSQTATASQTDFTISGGYRLNAISVYRNGVRLVSGRDYSAADGSTVVLLSPATVSDSLEFHIFDDFRVADAIVSNASQQNIEGNITITGNIDATNAQLQSLTVTNDVSIGGTLTYEDVKNIDSVGVITARTDVHVGAGLSVVGISTLGSLQVIGTCTFNGNIDLGNASSDTITATGRFDSDLIPSADDEKDLGSSALEWRNLYLDGTANIDTLSISGISTFTGDVFIADKIVHTGDTNTAIRFPAADTITAETGGTERLRITSAGNVGIKTTAPNNTLTVGDGVQTSYAPSTAGNYLEIARTNGADAGLLINKNTGQWLVGIDNSDGANAPLRFEYGAAGSAHPGFGAGTLGMIIKHDGKVGIGTDNPNYKLVVAKQDNVVMIREGAGTLSGMTNNTSQKLWFQGGNAELGLFKDSSGNYEYILGTWQSATHIPLVFRTGNRAERMRVTFDGKVGIGTTNPSAKLEVSGDARVTGILTVGTSSVTINGNTGKVTGVSDTQLAAISSSISDTAVDVFVYDTSKDSDGGAWRKRTQNTSWYNETLNTSTRGSRKEFPAVAVFVAESNPNRITIYDGDDPDLPMWMVFTASTSTNSNFLAVAGQTLSSVAMLNGDLCIGFPSTNGWGVNRVSFVEDSQKWYWISTSLYHQVNNTVAGRNVEGGYYIGKAFNGLVNALVNDVAMTVLPNAPISPSTGLPIPTIAVGTEGGVSVVRDDGNVVDLTGSDTYVECNNVFFSDYGKLLYDNEDTSVVYEVDIPSSDINYGVYNSISNGRVIYPTGTHAGFSSGEIRLLGRNMSEGGKLITKGAFAFDANGASETINGLTLFDREESDPAKNSLIAFASTSYNTGWMHGDVKGAFLSDTDTTNMTGGNLISNGDAWSGALSSTSSTPPTGWTGGNGAKFRTNSGGDGTYINLVNAGSAQGGPNSYMYQAITTVAGRKYKISLTQIHHATITVFFAAAETTGGSQLLYNSFTSSSGNTPRELFGTFTATGTTTYIRLGIVSGTNDYWTGWDNVVVTEVDEDRSVNANGLHSFGTITKSAVATGAELVAYSGFSASNYLQQPYNSDLAPGTAAYSVSCWFKTGTSSTDQYIFDRNGGGSNNSRNLLLIMSSGASGSSANKFQFWHRDGSGNVSDIHVTDKVVTDNIWHQVVAVNDGSTYRVYVDGEVSSVTNSVIRNVGNDNSPPMFIGIRHSAGSTFITGSMALFRYSKSAPSPEQIKKMYEDEKHLFQENAKATLYGSSDAVTALAFDDDTNLLHVGTSAGRSEFQGLRRINNTTDAVTTAISASNGLVAEQ